jgi:hypothetical protein
VLHGTDEETPDLGNPYTSTLREAMKKSNSTAFRFALGFVIRE